MESIQKRGFEHPLYIIKEMLSEKSYLRKVLAMGIPAALQQMLNMVVNLLDTVMIGKLGETAIASVGLANKLFFVFILINFGIMSGSGILVSQYWGSRDLKNMRKVLGLGIFIAAGVSLVFMAVAIFSPKMVMGIFSTNPDTIAVGAEYLRVVCFSYLFAALSGIYNSTLRSTGEAKIPLYVAMIAIVVNLTLNYVLIFGKFGAPALGVVGAALATVISRIVEFIMVQILMRRIKSPVVCKFSELLGYSGDLVFKYLRCALPVIANEFMWGLGTTIYSVVYGRMGNAAVAAMTISGSLIDVTTVWMAGLASTTAIVLGNELGANHLGRAKRYGTYSHYMSFVAAGLCIIIILIAMNPFITLYEVSDEVKLSVIHCFLVFMIFVPFKSIAWINIVGVLRSGGDTIACLFLDTSGVWLIGIPLAFLGGLVWKLPVHIVMGMVMLEEIYKCVLGFFRYRQYKWLKNLVVDNV